MSQTKPGRGRGVPSGRGTAAGLALVLLGLSLGAAGHGRGADDEAWELSDPRPAVPLEPERIADAESLACAACHAEVVREWADSAHALAWQDVHYREELADRRRPELCYGCHIPEPLFQGGELARRPRARDADRDHGISCESCHLGPDGTMLGATGAATDAHPTAREPAIHGAGGNALCASCHRTNIGPVIGIAKDFEASGQAERGRSCIGCHMAPVERLAASSPSNAVDAAKRTGRSHRIQTPRDPTFLRRAFEPELVVSSGEAVVRIANRAGHRVPGLIGRTIDFEVELLDDSGAVVARGSASLDARAYLPVDGSLTIELGRAGRRARVRGLHTDPRASDPVPFLDEHLTPRGEDE